MVFPANLHMERQRLYSHPDNSRDRESWRRSRSCRSCRFIGLIVVLTDRLWLREGLEMADVFADSGAVLAFTALFHLDIVQLNATVAEHWLYLPSVGFLIFLTGSASDFAAPTPTCFGNDRAFRCSH